MNFTDDRSNVIYLYRLMMLTRLFDQQAVTLQRTGKLGTYASCLGQEATSIGIGSALQPEDVFCPTYRDVGTQLMRGVRMVEILNYWGGSERGNYYANPMAKEDLPNCVPIASQCLHAAGIATAMKLRNQQRATLVTCGDGATSEGDFYEALNVAGVWHLPLVIVIINNQWAISVPRSKQTGAKTLAQKAVAAEMDNIQIDGNDVVLVRETVANALKKARDHAEPTLIEALTYRLGDHTTADDAARYRSKEELTLAWQHEPLSRLHQLLVEKYQLSSAEDAQIIKECTQQVELAAEEYLQLPEEPMENMFNYHFAQLPQHLAEQLLALRKKHA